jgi:quercetin 2,3-dioxygenase
MSAGTGFVHSEFNPSKTEPLHFMQIWIIPDYTGLPPSYEQKVFPVGERGRMQLVAAPYGGDGAVTLHQDARLFIANLGPGEGADHRIEPGRGIWMQLARGIIALNGTEMREGDGAAVEDEPAIEIEAKTEAELLEQIPSGLNREGFPNRLGCDSSCMLVKEASMHGSIAVLGSSRAGC